MHGFLDPHPDIAYTESRHNCKEEENEEISSPKTFKSNQTLDDDNLSIEEGNEDSPNMIP